MKVALVRYQPKSLDDWLEECFVIIGDLSNDCCFIVSTNWKGEFVRASPSQFGEHVVDTRGQSSDGMKRRRAKARCAKQAMAPQLEAICWANSQYYLRLVDQAPRQLATMYTSSWLILSWPVRVKTLPARGSLGCAPCLHSESSNGCAWCLPYWAQIQLANLEQLALYWLGDWQTSCSEESETEPVTVGAVRTQSAMSANEF